MNKRRYRIKNYALLIPVLIISFMISVNSVWAEDIHFPSALTNDSKQKQDKSAETVVEKVDISSGKSGTGDAVLVFPDVSKDKELPAVLFLHYKDESPSQQIDRIRQIAGKGYVVLCAPWKNHVDSEAAYDFLLKHKRVDETATGVIGVHEGGTEAIFLAIRRRRQVKAVIAIASHPPYDMPGGDPASAIWAPVFLIHGEDDTQTPPSVSQYFYFDLLEKGRIARIILVKYTRHYYNDAEWSQILSECTLFMDEFLKGIKPENPAGADAIPFGPENPQK